MAADLRRRQEPRPPDAPDGPQEAPHGAAGARAPVAAERAQGAERAAGRRRARAAAAVLRHEQVQEEGHAGDRGAPVGGGGGGDPGHVRAHGHRQGRPGDAAGAQDRAQEGRLQARRAGDGAAHGGRRRERQRVPGLRRVRGHHHPPAAALQRRLPPQGVPLLRQGQQRLHRARRARRRARRRGRPHRRRRAQQRPPRSRHRQGRADQLRRVRGDDEGRHGLEEGVPAVLEGAVQDAEQQPHEGRLARHGALSDDGTVCRKDDRSMRCDAWFLMRTSPLVCL